MLLVDDTAKLALDKVTVTGQDAGDNYVRASGGICYDSTGSLSVLNSTVTAGASNGKGYNYNNPAAIFTVSGSAGSVAIDNSTVTGGAAAGYKMMDCGASAAINANGSVNVTISGGSKLTGGASERTAGNAVEYRGSGKLTVTGSTLTGGSSAGGIGGSALFTYSSGANVEVTDSTITGGNGGTSWDGSGIECNEDATITVKSSTVKSGNGENATGNAAAITLPNNNSANLTLEDTTLSGAGKNTVVKYGLGSNTTINGTLTIAEGKLEKLEISAAGDGATIKVSEGASVDAATITSADDTKVLKEQEGGSYTFETTTSKVAQIGDVKYETLKDAIDAAKTGDTVTLLANTNEDVTINKNITLDLGGKTLTNTSTGKATISVTGGTVTVKNGTVIGGTSYYNIEVTKGSNANLTLEGVTATAGNNGSSMIDNWGTLTINSGTYTGGLNVVKSEEGSKLTITGGTFTLEYAPSSGYTATILVYGDTTITGGEFIQNAIPKWGNPQVVMTGVVEGYTAITRITGGTFTNKKSGDNIFHGLGKATSDNFEVSGGTFNKSISDGYCADGFIPTKNADGTYGVREANYVAQVLDKNGNPVGVKYETLQEAIKAARKNATVTLLADTKENVTIDKALTLDLNGHTLNGGTVKGTPTLKIDTARVTVMDSSEAKTGTIMREDTAENSGVSSHYVIDIQGKNALLIFNSGNVRNNSGNADGSKGASLVRVGNDSDKKAHPVLTIAGGAFTQDNFIAIKVDFGTLHLKGGTVSSKTYAVENWLNANIKENAVVNGNVSSWTYSDGSNSTTTISGGTINGNIESVSYDGAAGKKASVSITGGVVNGMLSTHIYNKETEPSKDIATIEVTGGTFSSDPSKYLVEGSTATENENGTFGVAKAYLAKVGNTSYYTMEEAFKAQTASGEAIVLLRDYTTGSPFRSGSINRTVDLNGHTWTCTGTDANSAAFEINYPNASLTVKNGKIVSSQLVGLIPSAMGGTITYDNSSLTFENVEMSTTATSGIETNGNNTNDTVTLKNSTLDVPNGFGIYFPSSGTLTIDNSTITAKTMGVQVCAGSLNVTGADTAITVSGDGIEKTGNDGAIQDGAAISIVNRAGYKGLGDVTVTGGTFTAKTGNAAIKAYDWDNTNKVEKTFTANDKVFVSGGTFSSAVPEGLCAEGYIPTKNEGGTHTVKKGTYVAEYNGTKYETLQKAIDAASQKNGGQTEVKLLCNLTITETVNFAKEYSAGSVLLNLGGYTLTGEGCRALQINKGSLYLENGTVTSTGIIDSSSVIRIGSNEETYNGATPMLYMQKDAKVVAPESYGVTIFGSATRGEKLKVMSNAEIIATGPSPAISGNGGANYNTDDRTSGWKAEEIIIGENAVISAANNYAIYHPECGTLNIQGGTITGTGGIQMCSGTLKISNSPKITANGSADYDYTGDAGVVYDAAAISVINRGYPQGPATVTIKGTPTVTAANGEVIHAFTWSNSNKTDGEWAEAGDYINVSGGTYNKQFNEAYLAADCTLVTNSEGGYTVEQKKVAEYNGIQYTSLSQAIRDANNSGAKATVKLLDNVTLTNSLGIGGTAKVTLNLNRKTLTLDGAQIYTQGRADVIINSGTIERIDAPTSGSPNDFAIQVMSGSSLTLGATSADTVTIKSTYGVYNAGGTLTVGHATINTDGWSVAVNDSASKTGVVTIGEGAIISSQNGNCIGTMVGSKPNVTITGGQLTSNGTAWDAGVIYWASEGTLTITGGTFTASSAEGSTAAAVYQKNGTVKISGTTAKLLGNNALVVKSGEGSTGTMITELSGGTYSTRPEDSWVVNGYRAIENTDGTYTVKGANIAIQVTSRIKDDGVTTVSTTTGGGMYCEGEKVTVTTSNVVGFEFLGWYEKDSYTPKLSADLSYTFTASKNCTLVALYSPAENATLTVKVTASAFRITGSKWVQNNGGMYKLPVGSSVTVTYTDDTYTFLYWVNGSDKIVSTSPEYTFTLGSNTELRACTSPKNTSNDNAMVVFKTAYDQVLTAKRYGNDEEIVFPMGPSKTGYKFIGWSMTQAKIRAAMAENDYIVVTPEYETLGSKYTVTVKYEGIDKADDTHTLIVGDSILLTAETEVDGKTFSCWKIGNEVVSYLTTLTVFDTEDVTVTAVYGEKVTAEATIRITGVTTGRNGNYYQLIFSESYAVPETATFVQTGFVGTASAATAENLTLDTGTPFVSKLDVPEGSYEYTMNLSRPTMTVYMKAYVQYMENGELQTLYSDMVSASYNSLTKGGNN